MPLDTIDAVADARPVLAREVAGLVEGVVCRNGWVYDTAFAAMTIELLHASLRQRLAALRASGARW